MRKDTLTILYLEFNYILYILIRLSNIGTYKEKEILTKLNEVRRLYRVFSILELPDKSIEIVILKSYILEL